MQAMGETGCAADTVVPTILAQTSQIGADQALRGKDNLKKKDRFAKSWRTGQGEKKYQQVFCADWRQVTCEMFNYCGFYVDTHFKN